LSVEKPALWNSSDTYDRYMGRWIRKAAPLFLNWLDAPAENSWVYMGCGSDGLTHQIATNCSPSQLLGIDSPEGFLKELVLSILPGAVTLGGYEQSEQLKDLDLPSQEETVYLYCAINVLVEWIEAN